MSIKNLRRYAAVVILAPVMLVSAPAVASAQEGTSAGRHSASMNEDGGDGILSNLVTVNLGRDSDRRNSRDGILSNLITLDLGSSERDSERRNNRSDRDDGGILNDILGDDGLFGDDDGLLGLRIL